MVSDDDVPQAAVAGETSRGDCIALLTPTHLVVGGGGIDRVYDLDQLTTVVVVPTSSGPALLPASTTEPGDMFLARTGVAEFAATVRARLLEIRPPSDDTPLWQRADFVNVVRLEDAGLLIAPRSSPIPSGTPVVVTITAAGAQLRERDGRSGMVVAWPEVKRGRVVGVDQIQTRPIVGAVVALGVLGLAARKTERRAYLTIEVDGGEFLIEDTKHLPLELRSLLAPFVASLEGGAITTRPRRHHRRVIGDAEDDDVWAQVDQLGEQGWEAVGITAIGERVVILLKRPGPAHEAEVEHGAG